MPTLKAGCFLLDLKTKKIALVYREKQKDFSFPKGHLENGESLITCAIRETAEETKRKATVLTQYQPNIEDYTTSAGEQCRCYMFYALDNGQSNNTSQDTHKTIWCNLDEVEEKLTSDGLVKVWNEAKTVLQTILNNKI